jgi:hypothetical protein
VARAPSPAAFDFALDFDFGVAVDFAFDLLDLYLGHGSEPWQKDFLGRCPFRG